ncbi:MAG TPA: transcription antitermination factor NusB [Marmoricola sp.]|nr:transcription antitermination factor NusB [Marmoricola sp.]
MSARSKARKRALDLVFAAEARGRAPGEYLDEQLLSGDRPSNDYTVTLVRGVAERLGRIDELISTYAEGWSLDRMPAVDRNVLRLGVFEVLWVDDVPDAVAVSEAVNLVRELSTDESPAFVNGVLGHIVRDKDRLTAQQ